ncbi:MAG: sigma 54-interacting transcriptional regulator [Polyangiaceae bacterium]
MRSTTIEPSTTDPLPEGRAGSTTQRPGFVVLWSADDPGRVGELVAMPAGSNDALLGRAHDRPRVPLMQWQRQRPGITEPAAPFVNRHVSREQLRVRQRGAQLEILNEGRLKLRVDGRVVDSAEVSAGQLVEIAGQLLLLVVVRPDRLPPLRSTALTSSPFGRADEHGISGEGPTAWALREQLAFVGARSDHVLVLGPSGSGKELCARALHALSARAGRPFIARNAATLPAGLVDAEMFGNVKNYPNPGMAERPGLVGEADGGTLMLDEIGELGPELQAHMLRLLDAGEYQRLGDARVRKADVRVIAATNREVAELKHDLAARFKLRIHVPGLNERREDIPLLIRALLARIAASDPAIGARFWESWSGTSSGQPRITCRLVEALVKYDYSTHARELERLLWIALSSADSDNIDLTPALEDELGRSASGGGDTPAITREALLDCLEKNDWVIERTWRQLRLNNRHVLRRLMKKHGVARDDDTG